MTTQSKALVVLRSGLTLEEALTLRSALAAAGVEARAFDADMASINWAYLFALGGIRMMVHESDFEVASLIATEGDHSEDRERCTACGSTRIIRKKSMIGAIAGFVLAGLPLSKRTRKMKCVDCRHVWEGE